MSNSVVLAELEKVHGHDFLEQLAELADAAPCKSKLELLIDQIGNADLEQP